eukprot:TRINITY_DN63954_c0_g1_i1.p1 TRINITY_DN63954_c0_g1~~TRINITY_DN63954_c0_g1_i1.p1  ORF type:complete len:301 (-),score=64.60 TRINITY_DN63954_c0_g1_i1:95-997(-)
MAIQVFDKDDAPHACRSMVAGILRLATSPFRPKQVDLIEKEASQPMLVPVSKRRVNPAEDEIEGTYPQKMVQLSRAAGSTTLRLGYAWRGLAELSVLGICLKADGKMDNHFWDGKRGNLNTAGFQCEETITNFLQDASGTSNCEDDDCDEDTGGSGGVLLQLDKVPQDTFAVVIALVASNGNGAYSSSNAFLQVQEVAMNLSQDGSKCPFWRYAQGPTSELSNVWVNCFFYRGPHGTWRLEPLNMKQMMMVLDDEAVPEIAAAEEAARATAWQLRWLMKDRRWTTASEERGIRVAEAEGY